MKRLAFVATACLAVPSALADEASERALRAQIDAAREELRTTERVVFQMIRRVPSGFHPDEAEETLRKVAREAELGAVEIRTVGSAERVAAAGGMRLEVHHLEVSGRDRLFDVLMFLQRANLLPRLVAIEKLQLRAAPGKEVAYSARLALPAFAEGEEPGRAAPPMPRADTPAATLPRRLEAAREAPLQRELAERRDQLATMRSLARALVALGDRARQAGAFLDALADFAHDVEDQAAALTEVVVEEEAVFRGVTLGTAARAGLPLALEKAGFQVGAATRSPAGDCEAFVIKGRLRTTEVAKDGLAGDVFDDRTAAACRQEATKHLGRVAARGSARGPGALTLRLRDADVADLFRALHELTGQAFVLDSALEGRLDVEIEGATLDEVLAATRAAGLAVGAGPLRRVSSAAAPPAGPPGDERYTGDPLTTSFKAANLTDVLCLFHNVTGLPILVRPDLSAEVSVFARDLPWDRELDALVSAAGLRRVIDGNRLYVGTTAEVGAAGHPGFLDVCAASAADGGRSWSSRFSRADGVGVEDLRLAGLARRAGGWTAFAYSPSRMLFALEAGNEVKGARVTAVGPAGVRFVTDAKRTVEMAFPP